MLGGIRVPGLERRAPRGDGQGNQAGGNGNNVAAAGAAGGGEPTSKELRQLLVRAKVPVLDTSLFAPGVRARLRRPRPVKTLIDSMVTMRRIRKAGPAPAAPGGGSSSRTRLDLSRLSDAELQSVLWYLARQAGEGGGLSISEKKQLRSLPIFSVVGGGRTSIEDGEFFMVESSGARGGSGAAAAAAAAESGAAEDIGFSDLCDVDLSSSEGAKAGTSAGAVPGTPGALTFVRTPAVAAADVVGETPVHRLLRDLGVKELGETGLLEHCLLPAMARTGVVAEDTRLEVLRRVVRLWDVPVATKGGAVRWCNVAVICFSPSLLFLIPSSFPHLPFFPPRTCEGREEEEEEAP